ncbi:hypothetical protein Sste5346_010097 [Sporothrix stenoceras]|uniref:Heterokaryon incompatibility domain-containing protein n=1 Tax=Sporothrix stenoceras TaxID=5173 RepID=A0ABR3YH28_9PEZI
MTSASPAVALATASLPHPNAGITASLYEPLRQHESDNEVREIRLLLIDEVPPDNAEDQLIVCRLNTCTVAEAQRSNFYALSYVWGDPLDTLPILVNGLTFYATRNLVEALRHVPLVEPRCRNGFWVDAVCVNQSDNHEKRAQVSMMRDIYSGAYETLAWLGSADSQSRAAIQLVNRISSDKDVMGEYAANGSKNEKSPASPRPELLAVPDVVELIDKLGDDSLFTTDIFSRRSYWFRIWTFQEIILGSRVRLTAGTDYCDRNDVFAVRNWALHASVMAFAGDRSLLADEDLNAEDHDHEKDKAKAAMIQRIRTFLADIKESANSGTHFHRQIVAFRFTQTRRDVRNKYIDLPIRAMACLRAAMMRYAWDTRDMIFGLCGIEDFGVAIDYDLSVRELFCKVAVWLATLLGSSGEQCIIHNTKNYTPVPEKYAVSVAEDVLRLRMYGIYIGTIGSVSKPGIYPGVTQLKEGEPPMTDSEKLQRLADAAEFLTGMDSNAIIDALAAPKHPDVAPTTRRLHAESLIVTLVELLADPYRSGHYTYTTHNTACLIHCLVASGRVSLPAPTDDSDPGDSTLSAVGDKYSKEPLDRDDLLCEAAYQFQMPDFQSCFFGDDNLDTDEYVYFRTDDGHSGYAAVGVQLGDVVYMVAGCQDVVVLRPVEDHFKFLTLGCIVGLGGHYPVTWDNPPGKVDVINIM